VLLPALSTLVAQTLSLERWLTVVIMGSVPMTRAIAMPPPTPDGNDGTRSLGECG
jgi:hypothetical protein